MEIFASVGIGLALAVDASVTAFSCGIAAKTRRGSAFPLKLAAVTAVFQGAMPLLGFFAAETFVRHIHAWAHIFAAAVFVALGTICIVNALRGNDEKTDGDKSKIAALQTWKGIFVIGVATSIDALAVGFGIACDGAAKSCAGTEIPLFETIFVPAAIFTGTTFACVYAAFGASHFFRCFPEKILGVAAGLILLALGIRAALGF